MLPDIEKLLELQVADREIRKLHDEVATLPKRVAVIEEKLAGTKARIEKARAAVKADEAAQAITGPYRKAHPEDNNERQPIHEHVSAALNPVKSR